MSRDPNVISNYHSPWYKGQVPEIIAASLELGSWVGDLYTFLARLGFRLRLRDLILGSLFCPKFKGRGFINQGSTSC